MWDRRTGAKGVNAGGSVTGLDESPSSLSVGAVPALMLRKHDPGRSGQTSLRSLPKTNCRGPAPPALRPAREELADGRPGHHAGRRKARPGPGADRAPEPRNNPPWLTQASGGGWSAERRRAFRKKRAQRTRRLRLSALRSLRFSKERRGRKQEVRRPRAVDNRGAYACPACRICACKKCACPGAYRACPICAQ